MNTVYSRIVYSIQYTVYSTVDSIQWDTVGEYASKNEQWVSVQLAMVSEVPRM